MPIAKVQHVAKDSNQPINSQTLAGPVVAGNVLSAYCRANVALAGITPPAGFTARKTQDDGSHSLGIWDRVCVGGDSRTVTFTFSGSTLSKVVVFEFSGVAAAVTDGTSSANPGSVASVQPGPITPTGAGDAMVLGVSTLTDSGSGWSVGGSFVAVSGGQRSMCAYKIKSDAGAENPLVSWATAADAAAVMVAYKAADAGPGGGGGGGGTTLTPQPWNPWNPLTVGMEWVPRVNPAKALDNDGTAWAARFVSSVAETIDQVQLYVSAVPSTARIAVEVFERGDEPCGTMTTETFRPSADVSNTNPVVPTGALWRNAAGTTAAGTLFQSIDEATLDVADFLDAPGSAYGAELRMRFGTTAFAAGRRATQIRVKAVVASYSNQLLGFRIRNTTTGAEWQDEVAYGPGQATVTFTFPEINPWSLYPWTPTDIDGFASVYEIAIYHPTTNPQVSRVLQLWMEVDSVPENRVAVTSGIFVQGATGWGGLALKSPDGSDNWAKAAGVEYSIAARRVTDRYLPGGSASWSYFDLGDGCPHVDHHVGYWLVDAQGCYVDGTEIDFPIPAFAINLIRTDTDVSVDSQPYAVLGVADIVSDSPVSQTLVPPSGVYGRIRSRVKRFAETTEPLTAAIGSAGTATTLTVDEFDALPDATGGWKLLDLELVAGATISGSVTLRFSTTDLLGWQITYLDTMGSGDDATFGGTTSRVTMGGGDHVTRDLVATISTLPATPTAFTVELKSTGLTSPLGEVTPVDYVRLTWSASTLPADLFAAYRLERWDPVGIMWRPINRLTDITKPVFHDSEPRRGIATSYRARIERADGALSQATVEVGATPTAPERPLLMLVSNENPGLNMVVVRETAQDFSFLDAGRDQLRALFGRDGWVALREAESRFDAFATDVLVAMDAPVSEDTGVVLHKPGRSAFDQLLALSRADLSYVCVLDEMGGRWFAHLGVPNGRRSLPLYSSGLVVTELTRVPSTPNVVPAGFVPPPPPASTGPPTFRSVTNVTDTGTVTKPAGTAQHDALIAVLWADTVSSEPSATGFSLIAYRDAIATGRGVVGVFLKFATGAEGASYTFTMPGAGGSAISLMAYQPTSAVDPLLVDVGIWNPTSAGNPHDIIGNSITVDAPSTLLFLNGGHDTTPFVAPTGMASRAANFRSPTGATLVADQAVAVGATGDRIGQANDGPDLSIMIALKGGAQAGGGLPPPDPGVGPVGFIGCSVTHQSTNGYRRLDGERLWTDVHNYAGGGVIYWADPNDEHWDAFDAALAIADQPVALWFQFCSHEGDTTQATLYTASLQVLDLLAARCPNVPIYVSALNGYSPSDPEIPNAAMTAAVAQLVSEGRCYDGPHMEDILLTEDETDGAHPNDAGERRLGAVLLDFWG